MGNLSNQYISASYQSVLNMGTGSGASLTSTLQPVTDGFGTVSPLSLSTSAIGITSGTVISGSLIPQTSGSFDLGTPTSPWRHIYAGSGSFYLDNNQVLTLQNEGADTAIKAPDSGSVRLLNDIYFDATDQGSGYGGSGHFTMKGSGLFNFSSIRFLGDNYQNISGNLHTTNYLIDNDNLTGSAGGLQINDFKDSYKYDTYHNAQQIKTFTNGRLEAYSIVSGSDNITNINYEHRNPEGAINSRLYLGDGGAFLGASTGSVGVTELFNSAIQVSVNNIVTGIDGSGSLQLTNNSYFINADTILSGSLYATKIIGTGSIFLKPNQDDARTVEIYNTSATDTHITGSGGVIFLGDDTTYVKVDNYYSDKVIAVKADNGVSVSGSLTLNNAITWNASAFNQLVEPSGALYFSALSGGTVHLNDDGGEGDVYILNTQGNKLHINGDTLQTGSIYQSGTFYADNLTFANSNSIQNDTGSYLMTYLNDGTVAYANYADVAIALGTSGTAGSSGTSGSSGNSGSSGTSGSNGVAGSSGTSGSSGISPVFDSGSYATTGSNVFVGNQTITGSLYVSSSIQKDVIVEGQLWVSSSNINASGSAIQPQINVVGGMGGTRDGSRSGSVTIRPASVAIIRGNSNTGYNADGFNSFGPDLAISLNGTNSSQISLVGTNLDTIDNQINLRADLTGTQFRDWDNNIQDYSAWLTLGPNDGISIPAPQFTRGLGITGSLNVSGDILMTGSLNVSGDIVMTGSLNVSGDIVMTGSLNVSGNITGSNILIHDSTSDISRMDIANKINFLVLTSTNTDAYTTVALDYAANHDYNGGYLLSTYTGLDGTNPVMTFYGGGVGGNYSANPQAIMNAYAGKLSIVKNTEITGSLSINGIITGSNKFVGNTVMTGSLYVSSSIQKDVIVEGQLWVSSSNISASGSAVQPQINVVGAMSSNTYNSRSGSVIIKPASVAIIRGNSNTGLNPAGLNSFGPDLGVSLFGSNTSQLNLAAFDNDTIDNEINLYADLTGSAFRDWDNTLYDYTAWLTLGPNDGVTIPPVAFQRNVQITGSLVTTAGFGQVELLTNQTLGSSSDTVITFNNDEFDPSGWYNNEYFYYQPNIAGIYQISYSINFEPATGGTGQINVQVSKDNGTDINQLAINQHELNLLSNTTLTGTVFAQLDGNLDKVYLTAYSSVGQDVNGGNGTYLNIKLL